MNQEYTKTNEKWIEYSNYFNYPELMRNIVKFKILGVISKCL